MKQSRASDQRYQAFVESLLERLNMGTKFEDLMQTVFDELRGIVPYHRIAVALLDESAGILRLVSCRSDVEPVLKVGYAAHIHGSTLETLLESGQPRIINDLERYLSEKPESHSTALIVKEGMKCNLTLPLLSEGRPIGVVFFSCREKNQYAERHSSLLRRVAAHIAISIEKTRLIEALQNRNTELAEANTTKDQFLERLQAEVDRKTHSLQQSETRYRLLVKMARIVNSSLDVSRVFGDCAAQIHCILNCDRVSLLFTRGEESERIGYAVEFQSDGSPLWVDIPTLPVPGSAAEWVMQRQLPLVARDLSVTRTYPEDERLHRLGYRSYLYVPLRLRDRSLGILGLASREKNTPDQWDLEMLCELSEVLTTALDNAAAYSQIDRLKAHIEDQNIYLRDEIRIDHDFGNIVGDSSSIQDVRRAVQQVAATDSTVLILGETGTGKELIARAIHDLSPRREKLLVKVNCAALAPGIIASELFGHEKGAFTGADRQRYGRFETAEDGSIFLDEVSEIPLETQVMLLRVLQERSIERVGGDLSIPINTRVIAATNRDLKSFAQSGKFREDLFYRLNVFPISVPALRQRRGDIPALVYHFVERFSRRMDKQITQVSRRSMELLTQYDWPGNVRELENLIERAMIVSRDHTLTIDPSWLGVMHDGNGTAEATPLQGEDWNSRALTGPVTEEHDSTAASQARDIPLGPFRAIERQAILLALTACEGRVYGEGGAAELLQLKPTTLYGKMKKLGIRRRRDSFLID